MRSTSTGSRLAELRRPTAASVRSGAWRRVFPLAWLGVLAVAAACNELTGVNDLEIESCDFFGAQSCVGPLGCPGTRTCQSDDTPSECDCGSGSGAGGSATDTAFGSGGMSGEGGAAAPTGQGGGLGGGLGGGAGEEPMGSVAPYAVCSVTADCGAGHACDGGVCRKRCAGAADCTTVGSQCAPPLTQGENFCTANCDIFSPGDPAPGYQACGAGVHCLRSANLSDATDCFYTRGVTRDGSPCDRDGACLPGSICVRGAADEMGICRRLCQPGMACADGAPCGAFPSPVLIGGREVGICDARACDPVTPSRNDAQFRPCLDGAYCMPGIAQSASPQSTCIAPAGASAAGFACLDHTDCNAGLGCDGDAGQCAAWCRMDADCSAGSCVQLQTALGQSLQAMPGDTLGLCVGSGS